MEYLALEGGPPGFRQGFTCPALLGIPLGRAQVFGYGAFTLCRRTFQTVRLTVAYAVLRSRNPGV